MANKAIIHPTTSSAVDYALLSDIVISDFSLERRTDGSLEHLDLNRIVKMVMEGAEHQPIVYTAFDGDHFQLCPYMRRYVLERGRVPANPESILGYKDTVTARKTKQGVLLDDLAVLRGCDELWVFTEQQPKLASLPRLAEGVVVELLYFLKRKQRARVCFVSPLALLRGESPEPILYQYSYEDSKEALHPWQRDGILELANSGLIVDQKIPNIDYYICDPLDFKYSHWLREGGYAEHQVPLVPGLAIDLHDLAGEASGLGTILIGWARLSRLASQAYTLASVSRRRSQSAIAAILQQVWLMTHDASTLSKDRPWECYNIPKMRVGNKWPLTRLEGREE